MTRVAFALAAGWLAGLGLTYLLVIHAKDFTD